SCMRYVKSIAQLFGTGLGGGAVFGKKRHVAHLAPRSWLALPIVMQEGAWEFEEFHTFRVLLHPGKLVANEIDHGRRAEQTRGTRRQAADGADLLFELGEAAGVERVMARIMRARSHFIDLQVIAGKEKQFQTKEAHALHALHDGAGKPLRPLGDGGRDKGR